MSQAPRPRLALFVVSRLLVGGLLIAGFVGLDRTSNTLRIRFVAPWDRSSEGELYFWLGAILMLLPGAAFIGAGLSVLVRPTAQRLIDRLDAATSAERKALLFALVAIAWAIARIGNQVLLRGQPFTDDEDAVRFGGQVLASGSLWAPLPPMRFAFPELFLFQRNGQWTSFDFLGALLPWTFAELTHSETLIFSVFAALFPLGVALAVIRFEGTPLGLATGCAMLFSPMAITLSLTSHAHVVSRGLLAMGLGLVLFVSRLSFLRGLAGGICFGLAFATRTPESVSLLAPLCAAWAYDALYDPAARRGLLGMIVGLLPGVLLTLAYNMALSGSPGMLRGAFNEISVPYAGMMHGPFELRRYWPRFGNNLSYNFLTLTIWFFGPIGLVLAGLGARASRAHTLLGMGVLLDLCLTLLHDDRGLHMVGPIHLSETAIPLAILAAAGTRRFVAGLRRLDVPRATTCMSLACYTVLGLGAFSAWHMRALHLQALTRHSLMAAIEDVPKKPAIVLAAPFGESRRYVEREQVGGFVFEWRRARPDLSEPVLIVHDSEAARRAVRDSFPGRAPYVFKPDEYGLAPRSLSEI